MRKPKRMLEVEAANQHRGALIESWFPHMMEELGRTRTADTLGINHQTATNWLLLMGYTYTPKVVRIGEEDGDAGT